MRACIKEIVIGSSTQLFKDFEARLIKIGNYVEQSEINMKYAFRKYLYDYTNFMNDVLKKQADRVITELKAESDFINEKLKESIEKIMEEQKKSQELSSKSLT
jgi:hypothetical protein